MVNGKCLPMVFRALIKQAATAEPNTAPAVWRKAPMVPCIYPTIAMALCGKYPTVNKAYTNNQYYTATHEKNNHFCSSHIFYRHRFCKPAGRRFEGRQRKR